MLVQIFPDHSGLYGYRLILHINNKQSIHSVKINDETLLHRKHTAVTGGCLSSWCQGDILTFRPFHKLDYLLL